MMRAIVFGMLAILGAQATVLSSQPAHANTLHAAILPNEIGHFDIGDEPPTPAEFFATIINDTDNLAENCRIEPRDEQSFNLQFWATEPTQNRIIGQQGAPVNIAARGSQSFRFTLEPLPDAYIPKQRVGFNFLCDTHSSAPQIDGVNDVALSAGSPTVLLALATQGADNRLVLSTQLGDQECFGRLSPEEAPAPCATGAMALAMINLSEEPANLLLQVDTDGPQSLLCRTNEAGICQEHDGAGGTLQVQLEPNEIATFSAFLITFRDEFFGFVSRPRMAGFSVFGFNPESGSRQSLAARVATELISPAFQWSAVLTDGQIRVSGELAIPTPCDSGILQLAPATKQTPPEELHLELTLAEIPPDTFCIQVIASDQVTWLSDGPVDGIERVVVNYRANIPALDRPPLVLPVQNLGP